MKEENEIQTACKTPLGQDFWENKYLTNATGWDLGQVSPPLKLYIDKLQNKDLKILIPGCGNAYEAAYLVEQGFTDITLIDIAPALVEQLKTKFKNNKNITILLGDFFEHQGTYDLILEQTFFCALPPRLRQKYVWKMHQLLSKNGIISGLLFNRAFEMSPPFGGNKDEYLLLFQEAFVFKTFKTAINSIVNRENTELFFEFQKNYLLQVNLYQIDSKISKEFSRSVIEKINTIEGVQNVSMNIDSSEILIVSKSEIDLKNIQKFISDIENSKNSKVKKL